MKNKIGAIVVAIVVACTMIVPSSIAVASDSETVYPSGNKGTTDYNRITAALRGGNKTVKLVDGATYYICGTLDVYSNTVFDAGTAKIIQTKPGATMVRQDRNTLKKSKGYNAIHDITLDGGTWVGTTKYRADAGSKEGFKMGANVMNFLHAKNITIKNATIYNVYNAHLIELTGVANSKIENCNLGMYKTNGKWKTGFYKGSKNNGAIQLDACYSASNNPQGGYFDGTPCKNITISKNNIKYVSGIETAQKTKKKASNVIMKYNNIKYKHKPYILKNVVKAKKYKDKVSKY